MTHEPAVNLLVLSQSLSDTETYVSALRNAGLPVHATRVPKERDFSEALAGQALDLLLCAGDEDGIDITRIMEVYRTAGVDVPLIIISDDLDPAVLLQAMQDGARDHVAKGDLQHLQLVANREISALHTRRELMAAKRQLHEAEQRSHALIDSSRDAIAYVHEGMHVLANPAYLEMFGFVDLEELEGLPIMDMVVPEHHRQFKAFLRSLDRGDNEASHLELTCQRSDGSSFEALLEFSLASIDGEPATQIVIRSQANQKELEQKIQQLYRRDIQTGLYSRQYFLEKLEQKLQSPDSRNKIFSLLYITLDDMQELSGSVELAAGDAMLKEIAALFQKEIGPDDLLARFGDFTFTLLTENPKILGEAGLAETLFSVLDGQDFAASGGLLNPSCSIGVVSSGAGSPTAQEFTNRAYTACNAARREGENQAVLYQPAADGSHADEAATKGAGDMSGRIGNALQNDRFHLVYQPIVSLQGDTRENYAVLLRMLDDNDDEILPRDFLHQAVHDGLMRDLDRWVIRHAFEELEAQRKEGRKTIFFINLSAESLQDEGLLLYLCDCLRDFNIKGSWVCFQINEEDVRRHINTIKPLLGGLRKIKCQLALSQFGLSAKPEGLLKHLDFDYAKLDSSFMKDLATSQEKQDKLNAIKDLVHFHQVKSVATAVEDANSLAILWTIGISYIQGYFLQEPSETIGYDFARA